MTLLKWSDFVGFSYTDLLEEELESTKSERDMALRLLAEWCVAIQMNGTGWEDWDVYYKVAMYRQGPLRALLDEHIAKVQLENGN